jgi:predicted alpha/beta hydrolase family esterase
LGTWILKTVPGYTSSGPDHWQSHWERAEPTISRIEQRDWDHPEPAEWAAALETAIAPATAASTVLIGHSCGSLAVAHWVAQYGRSVAGAFLVAPSDVERPGVLAVLEAFGPVPLLRLPFPSLVVASEDDPYCSPERAEVFARAWGSKLVFVGRAGHLNKASGHGPWPEGRALLQDFCAQLAAGAPVHRAG